MRDLIQANFNNLAIKLSKRLRIPTIKVSLNPVTSLYKIKVEPNIDTNDYCVLNIQLDNEQYTSVKINTDYSFNIPFTGNQILITVNGYYVVSRYKTIIPNVNFVLNTQTLVSETTVCSEETYVNDISSEGGNVNG